ncbi:hypothetical protein [Erythrobacter sanguineus]|uniref:hypothetical protein n=1 Tax=Erythrobacter sanguineus TaxID=198312 RepID=UPI003D15F814
MGCPVEIKNHEYRVRLAPERAHELVARGHEVWIETRLTMPVNRGANDAAGFLNSNLGGTTYGTSKPKVPLIG